MSEQQYKYLTDEDTIQAGDEFWTGSAWFEYHEDCIGKFVHIDPSRRPIANAIDQPQRERIAYEELQAGDIIQPGDEWWPKDGTGQWQAYHQGMFGLQVLDASIARRSYRVSTILEIGDALANAQKAATQLQDERDDACRERDLARAEVARLSTELWARKPLEERVSSLTDEVAQLRLDRQEWIGRYNNEVVNTLQVSGQLTAAETALKSAQRARDELQLQVDELRTDRKDEPTARQVRDMLRTWAIELDWSADCFDSVSREQIDIIQKTLIAVIERIEWLCSEGNDDN